MLLGVDVGGTFTDAVLLSGSRLHTAKTPSTPGDVAEGVMAAVDRVLERAGAEPRQVSHFAHGMTVGTNALLERGGARTALVATAGFTDLIDVARQNRPSLYRLCEDRPAALAPAELRVAVSERTGPEGVIERIGEKEIDRVASELGRLGVESVAICLLFSYLDDANERQLAEALRERLDGVHVSASSEVLPRFREYERCSTTLIDAYLSPLLARYLRRLGERCERAGLSEPVVMRSSGGVAPLEEAGRGGAWSVLSGPAGGAVGAGILARMSGAENALGLDMGGTSCDVCVIEDGRVRRTGEREIGGRPIQLPMVDVHTVGAGGGSIGWRDRGGALRVGPRSAGAEPGPACYGKGGTEPTVTDANLALGRLGDRAPLAGGVRLDREAAERAIGKLAGELRIEAREAAEGIVRVANQEMVQALRVVTVERGLDPRAFALLAFGGAGGMHAAAIAAELGIERIIVPRAGGVLSALGLCATDRRRDLAKTVMLTGAALEAGRIAAAVEEMREQTARGMAAERAIEVVYELRYAGQAFELDVPGPERPDPAALREDFAAEHERRYGYRDPESEVELVGIRVAAIEAGPEIDPTAADGEPPRRSSRRAWLGGEWIEAAVLTGEPAPGSELEGPCIVELPEATVVVPPHARGSVDRRGTIELLLEDRR